MTRITAAEIGQFCTLGLRSVARFGTLSTDTEEVVRTQVADAQPYSAGSELLAEGERLPDAKILLSGWAARVRTMSDGRRQILSFVIPGDLFGIASRPGTAPFTIVALTAAVVAEVPTIGESLKRQLDGRSVPGDEAIAAAAWNAIRLEEACLLNQIVRLGRQTAYERTAHLLLELHDRMRSAGLADGPTFPLPLTQDMLSDALGLSVVHTNRTLQQLRRDALIEMRDMKVTLLQLNLMATIANWEELPMLARLH